MEPEAEYRKLYELALSKKESDESLQKILSTILRLALDDVIHFDFILHRIDWFSQPYLNHFSILEKALRLYQGNNR